MKITHQKNGFTLMELIVSISIIAIISSIMLANYRQGGTAQNLGIASQELISEIRKIQTYALGYKEFNGSIQPEGGWAIMLTSNSDASLSADSYLIFFETFSTSGPDRAGKRNNNGNEDFFLGKFNNGVYVSELTLDGVPRNNLYAIYSPPDPVIDLNGSDNKNSPTIDSSGAEEVIITLSHPSGGTKKILLNKFGLVDIID